ncbi:hypothetical protein BAE44_0015022 [Dichanthelium oligosanthes]|uniref:DUF295 domain-containing protein n=1 Tax=Dichanthelium oligosanthes TaxID=888268 RepID=A0A1E5VFQ1_9POAL|nr:hypothetical protein BAE44_0015022 [Dichanthelium oligosanthes]
MDSGAETAGGEYLFPVWARVEAGSEDPLASSWANLRSDALGVVLCFLPCDADSARVRSVCRHWSAAARGHGVAPPPLPLLVLPRFRFVVLTPGGVTAAARPAWMPREVDADHTSFVGCSGAWLVGARQAGGECFLVNAFSHAVLRLPHLGTYDCSVHRVVLSASPESGPDYIVAAFIFRWDKPELALWKPGMDSWRFCHHPLFAGHMDITFYQEKLYILWRFTPCLLSVELFEEEDAVTLSCMKDCLIEKILPSPPGSTHESIYNMVEWRGRLLLIIRSYGVYRSRQRLIKVEVFAMDLSTNPCELTEIRDFCGDCIFVGSGGCKSFPAGQHSGVEDCIVIFRGMASFHGKLYMFRSASSPENVVFPFEISEEDNKCHPRRASPMMVIGDSDFRVSNEFHIENLKTRKFCVSDDDWDASPLRDSGEMLDEMPQEKRARIDAGSEDPLQSPWASLPSDALGILLRFLPCLTDRARVRSVCRHWRAAARGHGVAPPPLPLLVVPRFRFASVTPGGFTTGARRAWMPPEVDADHTSCVGSSGAWLVGAGQAGGECFLVNAFSHAVLRLPYMGTYDCSVHTVVLSASPETRPDYTVAAFIFRWAKPELALWKPGMESWSFCHHPLFAGHMDIAFYQEKLFILWRFTPCLFSFELFDDEDEDVVTLSCMKDCFIERLLPSPPVPNQDLSYNMVEWRGRLLLIIRCYGVYRDRQRLIKVKVFAMDLSGNPSVLTEIHNFGGDCIFVGTGSCKSFPAAQHGGVEGDLIYFGPDHFNPHEVFAYSMRAGRPRRITNRPFPCLTRGPEPNSGFPLALGTLPSHFSFQLDAAGFHGYSFFQGKLYMFRKFTLKLYIPFEIPEDDSGLMVSRVERCVTEELPNIKNSLLKCNMAVWRGKLLLITRYFNGCDIGTELLKVKVFSLDINTNPFGATEIHSFDGDSIFVDTSGCKSFSAGLHVGVQGDLIYFIDGSDIFNHENHICDAYVYNIRDGTTRPLAVEFSPANSCAPGLNLDVPV